MEIRTFGAPYSGDVYRDTDGKCRLSGPMAHLYRLGEPADPSSFPEITEGDF